MMKRPDLLLLVAIWEFLTAFIFLVGMAAVLVFFPAFRYARGFDRIGNAGAIFIMAILSSVMLVYLGIATAAGIGVLMGREWGRLLAIVHASLSLLSFPFGTTLGILTIIYVTRAEVKEYFAAPKKA